MTLPHTIAAAATVARAGIRAAWGLVTRIAVPTKLAVTPSVGQALSKKKANKYIMSSRRLHGE